ncbi:rod shape-determining protein MreD [Chlamydiifrater phoenicopteri]|uniref:rod shape-determining protein MreD n=1 Tax=Chlamydiifrater phoenicopteri TaxID=2681469 RepID=UPI001BCC63BB|nr:rod shape-determining protein MreD [Chlamydiifrater phoenicopteri]
MYKRSTSTCFLLSLTVFLALPSIQTTQIQPTKLLCFAPYLAASIYKHKMPQVLLKAMFVGLLYDLFSSTTFGAYSLLHVLSALIIYRLKSVFLEEKLLSVPLITAIFSSVFYLLSYPIFTLFHFHLFSQKRLFLDIKNAFTIDFLYAIIIYVIPCLISEGRRRMLSLIRRFL